MITRLSVLLHFRIDINAKMTFKKQLKPESMKKSLLNSEVLVHFQCRCHPSLYRAVDQANVTEAPCEGEIAEIDRIDTLGLLNLVQALSKANLDCLFVRTSPIPINGESLSQGPIRIENKGWEVLYEDLEKEITLAIKLQNLLTSTTESLLL